jgi:putative endonuclease
MPAKAGIQEKGMSRDHRYYVYILASRKNGTLYIGVTNNLLKRVHQHKTNVVEGFTKQYGVHRLVYFEQYRDIRDAINREKRMKRWKRQWKINLIEKENPEWKDLFDELMAS